MQELICTIFDVNTMKQAMVEFDIDMEKMPLGKISKNQMKKAYEILSEAQALVEGKGDPAAKAPRLLDCSNRSVWHGGRGVGGEAKARRGF